MHKDTTDCVATMRPAGGCRIKVALSKRMWLLYINRQQVACTPCLLVMNTVTDRHMNTVITWPPAAAAWRKGTCSAMPGQRLIRQSHCPTAQFRDMWAAHWQPLESCQPNSTRWAPLPATCRVAPPRRCQEHCFLAGSLPARLELPTALPRGLHVKEIQARVQLQCTDS